MATVSIKDKCVVVRSKKVSQKIINDIRSGKRAFTDVKPLTVPHTKEEEAFLREWSSR